MNTIQVKRPSITTLFVSLLLVVALLAGVAPAPVRAAASAKCVANYTVKSGDTLSKIATEYKITVKELAAANDLKEPYTIFVGQKLCIPEGATTSSSSSSSSSSSTAAKFTVTVNGKFIVVSVTDFPKKNIYTIKAKNGMLYEQFDYYKVGTLRTKKKTAGTYVFKLPKDLRDKSHLTICLKNVVTDKVVCQVINVR